MDEGTARQVTQRQGKAPARDGVRDTLADPLQGGPGGALHDPISDPLTQGASQAGLQSPVQRKEAPERPTEETDGEVPDERATEEEGGPGDSGGPPADEGGGAPDGEERPPSDGTPTEGTAGPADGPPPEGPPADEEDRPVQARGNASPDAPRQAAEGFAGGGSQLPHFEAIQGSFGKHDVGHVKAYTGDAASRASAKMGATAYASGDQVAFAGTPDLHTSAHEAAHVVQQAHGVSLEDGVGARGDPYEQHADAVADKVVRGESAEPLLDAFTGGAAPAGVQRQVAVQARGGTVPLRAAAAKAHAKYTGLSTDHVNELWGVVKQWVPQLRNELEAFWTRDRNVIDLLRGFWKAARTVLDRQVEGIDVKGEKVTLGGCSSENVRAAKIILHYHYGQTSKRGLIEAIKHGCSGADERTALQLATGEAFVAYGAEPADPWAAEPNLTPYQLGLVRDLSLPAAGDLYKELHPMLWVSDKAVVRVLRDYKQQIDKLLHQDDQHPKRPPGQKFVKLTANAKKQRFQQAVHILKESYATKAGEDLLGRIEKKVDGDELQEAMQLLKSRPPGTGTFEGPKGHAYDQEIGDKIRGLARQLAAEFETVKDIDASNVLKILGQFRAALQNWLKSKTFATPEQQALERRAAIDLLEGTFASEYGIPLADQIVATMSDPGRTEALTILNIHAEVPAPPEVTDWKKPKGGALYPDRLSEDERAKLPNTKETTTSLKEVHDFFASDVTHDDSVLAKLEAVRARYEQLLAPHDGRLDHGDNHERLRARVDEAMGMFRREYDFRYEALDDEIDDHIWNAGIKSRCLVLVGSKADPTDTVVDPSLTEKKGLPEIARTKLSKLAADMDALAGEMAGELDDIIVDDTVVLGQTGRYRTRKTEALADNDLAPYLKGDVPLRLLERAYTSIRGDLRKDVINGLDDKNADRAFGDLGLGTADAAKRGGGSLDARLEGVEPEKRAEQGARLMWEDQVRAEAADLVRRLEFLRAMNGRDGARSVVAVYQAMVAEVTWTYRYDNGTWTGKYGLEVAGARAQASELYKAHAGVDLVQDLSMATCGFAPTAALLARETGLPVEAKALPETGEPTKEQTDKLAAISFEPPKGKDGSPGLRDFWDPKANDGKGSYVTFTLEHAAASARAVHQAARRRDDQAIVEEFVEQKRTGWHAQKVREVYEVLYAVPLKHTLQRSFAFDRPAYQRVAQAARITDWSDFGFTARIEQAVAEGNEERVYREVLDASPADKHALLNDTRVMTAIRAEFGAEAHERVVKACTGKLTIADLMAQRGAGLGTDEKGFDEDVKALFAQIRDDEKKRAEAWVKQQAAIPGSAWAGLKSGTEQWDTAVAREAVKHIQVRIVREATDGRTRKALEKEFSGDDLFKTSLLVASGGELTGTDKTRIDLLDTEEPADTLLASMKTLTDSERETLLADPHFLDELKRKCNEKDGSGLLLEQAMAILHGRKWEADILGAIAKWNDDEFLVFNTLAGLSAGEMSEFSKSDVLISRIRDELNTGRHEGQLLNELLADIRGIEAKVAGKGKAEGDALRKQEALVIKHTTNLMAAIPESRDKLLAMAQAVYAEKDFVSDAKDAKDAGSQRKRIRDRVKDPLTKRYTHNYYGTTYEDPVVKVVLAAIDRTADPSDKRLEDQFSGFNAKDEKIDETIATASDDHVARSWSNVVKPGEDLPSLYQVYSGYLKALKDQQDVAVWRNRFVDLELDVSADVVDQFEDKGALFGTGDARMLDLKQKVRKRIVALKNATVLTVLEEKLKGDALAVRTQDKELLVTPDRIARSEFEHRQDDYGQQMDQGSFIDLWSSKKSYLLQASLEYSLDLDKLVKDGRLSKEDIELLEKRRDEFDKAVEEYKTAKKAAAGVATLIATIVIGIVVSILTAGAASPFMAALISAGGAAATAVTNAALNEAFMGRDFEFAEEATKGVVLAVSTELLTFGVGKLASKALESKKFLKWAKDLRDKASAWKTGLKEAAEASGSHWQYFKYVAADAGYQTLENQITNLPSAAINAVDINEFRDGLAAGFEKTGENLGKAMGNIPRQALQQFFTTGLTSYTKKYLPHLLNKKNEKLDVEPPKDPTALTDPGSYTNRLKDSARAGFVKTFLLSKENAIDALGSTIAGKGGEFLGVVTMELIGAMTGDDPLHFDLAIPGWSEGEVVALLLARLQGTVTSLSGNVAAELKKANRAKLVYNRINKPKVQEDLKNLYPGDPEMNRIAAAAYIAYLATDAVPTGKNTLGDTPNAWKLKVWDKKVRELDKRLGSVDSKSPDAMAWKRYMLSDLSTVDVKLADTDLSFASFTDQLGQARDERKAIKSSAAYKDLDHWQQQYYDAYLSDPTRLRAFHANASTALDVRSSDGLKEFKAMYLATKKAKVREIAGALLPDDQPDTRQRVFDAIDAVTDPDHTFRELPIVDLTDPEKNKKRMERWIQAVAGAAI